MVIAGARGAGAADCFRESGQPNAGAASSREREMGMRMAVGATRGRLIRQLLAESLLLGLAGALLGAQLAHVLTRLLVSSIGTQSAPLFMT